MAEVLTDQAAQLYYQRIMVRVGLFTDEQRQSGVDAYNTYIAALEKFKAKTLAPMRFNKHIWQRSNVNKAAFDKMMHQLNGKAHEFQDLIPKIFSPSSTPRDSFRTLMTSPGPLKSFTRPSSLSLKSSLKNKRTVKP
jgi:hypothetical protein